MTHRSDGWTRTARAAALAAVLATFSGPAAAQTGGPRVWLAPLRTDDAPGAGLLSEKFDEASRRQLADGHKVDLVGPAGKEVKVTAGEADPRVAQAETMRSAGKEAFAQKQFPQALERFRGALGLYEEAIASVNRVDAITDTLLWLGAASQAQQYDDDARDFFKRAAAIDPAVEAPEGFPADAKALLDETREKEKKKKGGELQVVTTPPGAVVRVDGVEKGKSPITVKDLARGEHYVQASLPDAGLAGQKVRVKGGRAEKVDLKLSTDVGPPPSEPADPANVTALVALAAAGDVGPKFRDNAEAIAGKTHAKYIVVGHITTRGNSFVLKPFLYGVDEKQTAALDELNFAPDLASVFVQAANFARAIEVAVTQFPGDKVVVGGIVAATPPPAPVDEPPPAAKPLPPPPMEPLPPAIAQVRPPPPAHEDDGDAWYKQWWFWTIAGAAVIGGTAYGGYVLLQDDGGGHKGTFDATVRW
jgi:hypothetical protein